MQFIGEYNSAVFIHIFNAMSIRIRVAARLTAEMRSECVLTIGLYQNNVARSYAWNTFSFVIVTQRQHLCFRIFLITMKSRNDAWFTRDRAATCNKL